MSEKKICLNCRSYELDFDEGDCNRCDEGLSNFVIADGGQQKKNDELHRSRIKGLDIIDKELKEWLLEQSRYNARDLQNNPLRDTRLIISGRTSIINAILDGEWKK